MAYPPETQALVKALYKSGRFGSVEELHKFYQEQPGIKKVPSLIKLRQWCKGLKKDKNAKKIEEKAEEKTIEAFARIGLPKDAVLRKIKGLVNSKSKYFQEKGIKLWMDLSGERAPTKTDLTSGGKPMAGPLLLIPDNGRMPNAVG